VSLGPFHQLRVRLGWVIAYLDAVAFPWYGALSVAVCVAVVDAMKTKQKI
jgi:hypothetical protein